MTGSDDRADGSEHGETTLTDVPEHRETSIPEPSHGHRSVQGPALAALGEGEHLLVPVIERARQEPSRPMASYRKGDSFVDLTAAEFYKQVRGLAKGLMASGVEAGDRVALMSKSRLEWQLLDYAILAVGGVTVPIYETSSADQASWIVADSGAVLVMVETPAMQALAVPVIKDSASRELLVIDEGATETLVARGATVDDAALDERIGGLNIAQLATIVYTSGTTGRPKGCAMTHANLRTNARQSLDAIRPTFRDDEVILMFLPMAHTLAKMIALVGVEGGAKAAFASGIDKLPEELPMVRPTLIVAVPRVFEKVYDAATHTAEQEGKGPIFRRAADTAARWSRDRTSVRRHLLQYPAAALTNVEHALFKPLVYHKLEAVFGGRLQCAFSGGGPLGERLTHFFNGVGVRIFEGYGLTETSPVLTMNRPDRWGPGTVGPPVAGTTIALDGDGEILAKGPQVFAGYWRAEAATAQVFDEEGWFRTGDLGAIDESGFLRITGRKKELIVTAAGKNVAPGPLEDKLRAHPLISQAMVVGDRRPFVGAIVTLDEEAAAQWAAEKGIQVTDGSPLHASRELRAVLQEAVDQANTTVSRAESIRAFEILPRDLTIDAGELTPTMKVRRTVVETTYADVIERIYGS